MGTLVGSWQSSTMPSAYRPPFAAKTHSYSSFFFSGENCNFPFYIFWSSMLQGCTTNHLEIPLSARIFRSEIGKYSKMEKWKQAYFYLFWNRIQTTRLRRYQNGFTKTNFQLFAHWLFREFCHSGDIASCHCLLMLRAGQGSCCRITGKGLFIFEVFISKDKSISNLYLICFLVFFRVSMLIRSWSEMLSFYKGVPKLPLSAEM